MPSLAERVAASAYAQFAALPKKSKPRTFPDGTREWIPMSAVVMGRCIYGEDESLTCVSLATGTKCLPASAIPNCRGTVLHDSHAEILALRGLNRFLLSEIEQILLDSTYLSPFIERRATPAIPNAPFPGPGASILTSCDQFPFCFHPQTKVYLFTTSPPCGDASMDILVASRPEDNIPWARTPSPVSLVSSVSSSHPSSGPLHGHTYFSSLSLTRLKPSRPDAPPTLSKSCTDKLALKQYTGILSFPTYLFLPPIHLACIVVPEDSFDETGWHRAFAPDGRLNDAGTAEDRQGASFFEMLVLPAEQPAFEFARSPGGTEQAKAGNVSAVYVHRAGVSGKAGIRADVNETLIRGVKQGFKQLCDNPLKESVICRKQMWNSGRGLMELMSRVDGFERPEEVMGSTGDADKVVYYRDAKHAAERGKARAGLRQRITIGFGGWGRNIGDDEWELA